MLRNLSYNDKQIRREIDELVGKPLSIWERIKRGGNGSPKLLIVESSPEINALLSVDNRRRLGNIEIRPKGIIFGFRSRLEGYGLIAPFYKITIYKGQNEVYSIFTDSGFVKFEAASKDRPIHEFMKQLLSLITLQSPTRIEDL